MATAWLVFLASFRLTFQRIGLLLATNILWWLLTLPLITWPPATAGLFHVVRRLTNLDESEQTTWRHFFEGFRYYWLKSWQLMAINLILGLVIVYGFIFYFNQTGSILRYVAIPVFYMMLLWISMQLYLFPLLIEQKDKQIRLIFKNALVLALGNPIFTIAFGLLLVSVILVTTIPLNGGPLLLILISFLAVAQTLALQEMLGTQHKREDK